MPNYIWMINNFIVTYVRGLTVYLMDQRTVQDHEYDNTRVQCAFIAQTPCWDLASHDRSWHTSWWRHQMETFSTLLAICAENSPVPGEFTAQRPVTRSFDVFFDLRLNKRWSKQWWGWWFETLSHPLWRHRNVFCFFYWTGMTSWHRKAFRITGPLWGESQRASYVDLWCYLYCELKQTVEKQSGYRLFEIDDAHVTSWWWGTCDVKMSHVTLSTITVTYIQVKSLWLIWRPGSRGCHWIKNSPDSKIHGANMGPTWVLSAPDGSHVGPMNLAVREYRRI